MIARQSICVVLRSIVRKKQEGRLHELVRLGEPDPISESQLLSFLGAFVVY